MAPIRRPSFAIDYLHHLEIKHDVAVYSYQHHKIDKLVQVAKETFLYFVRQEGITIEHIRWLEENFGPCAFWRVGAEEYLDDERNWMLGWNGFIFKHEEHAALFVLAHGK